MMDNLSLLENIFYFNIGKHKSDNSYFTWESRHYHKSSFFQLKSTRNALEKDIFYCILKPDIKLVYYVYKDTDTVFTIGADPDVQSQLLEAIIEHIIEIFFDKSMTS